MNKTKSNKKKYSRQVIAPESENWTRYAPPALFAPVGRCVRFFWEQREKIPAKAERADLGQLRRLSLIHILDVENRTISITKQVTRTKGELVVSQPKTHNSIRVLPVSQQAVDLLVEEHKKHPGNPYMFPSPKTGGMFDPDSFRHTHEKILKSIGAEHKMCIRDRSSSLHQKEPDFS